MKASHILQWLLGTTFGLGLMVLLFASVLGVFSQNLLLPPERPEFNQEIVESPQAVPDASEETEEPDPSPEPSPEPENTTARVSYGEGLRIRDRPDREGTPLGGVGFDEEVILLEQSDDGEWQKIRSQDGTEGWVLGFGLDPAP